MSTPTKALCRFTKVANVLIWFFLSGIWNGNKAARLTSCTRQVSCSYGALKTSWHGASCVLCTTCVFPGKWPSRDPFFIRPTPPDSLKSMSMGETRLGLGVFGLLSVRGESEWLHVNVCVSRRSLWLRSAIQGVAGSNPNPQSPRWQTNNHWKKLAFFGLFVGGFGSDFSSSNDRRPL